MHNGKRKEKGKGSVTIKPLAPYKLRIGKQRYCSVLSIPSWFQPSFFPFKAFLDLELMLRISELTLLEFILSVKSVMLSNGSTALIGTSD